MSSASIALIAVACFVLAAAYAAAARKRLKRLGKKRDEAWGGVLAQLKRRHDLVPDLVGAVMGRMDRDRVAVEAVAARRTFGYSKHPDKVAVAEEEFTEALIRLMALADNYPAVQADRAFREAQGALVGIDEEIQAARRIYNDAVDAYNRARRVVGGMVAGKGFGKGVRFDLEAPAEADTPTVAFDGGDAETRPLRYNK